MRNEVRNEVRFRKPFPITRCTIFWVSHACFRRRKMPLNLEVGYFMTDNLSFGFRANAEVIKYDNDYFDENVRVYSFGPALTVHNRINSHFEYSPNLFLGYGLAKCDGADMANGLVANLSLLSFDVYATESLSFGIGFLDLSYGSVRFKDDMEKLRVKAKRFVFGVNPEVRLSVLF